MAATTSSDLTTGIDKLSVSDTSTADLRSKLKGVTDARYNGEVIHFRGIPYATIEKRFAKPEVVKKFPGATMDFTKFGPRCPQIDFDIRDFMHIPKTIAKDEDHREDELKCTNLTVTCPKSASSSNLPVLMWIYGGSQSIGFGSPQHRLGDPGPLVAQSIELGKPIILVHVHFRLNIFGFGDGEGEVNLYLQDQIAALKWIKQNIASFGGDPNNITIGGESAGAIHTHGLLASGVEVQRAIMQSGCLYTSPPQPEKAGLGVVGLIEGNIQLMEFDKGNESGEFGAEATAAGAPVKTLIDSLKDLQINRFWLWDEPYFKDWDNDKRVLSKLKGVLVGDCRDESTLYDGVFTKITAKKVLQCFETKKDASIGVGLAKAYGIDGLQEDHDTARQAAMNFMADTRFNAWPAHITHNVNTTGGKAYQYYFDEPNPFMKEDRAKAGHGVDLFPLFGGYDDEVNDEMRRVGRMMRTKWIDFINGDEPWSTNETYVFGPRGMDGAIDRDSNTAVKELNPRRRQAEILAIRDVGWKGVMEVWQNLMAAARQSAEP